MRKKNKKKMENEVQNKVMKICCAILQKVQRVTSTPMITEKLV